MFGMTLVIPMSIAVGNRVDADEPQRSGASVSNVGSPSVERFLLLSNGQIVQGVVSDDKAQYQVVQRVGVLRFPKKRVEGVFGSVREIYQYKLEQLPERDSEERMKLAHWCLNRQMIPQAREQLTKVVALNPKNQQAQAMLVSIDQAATIAEMRQRDPEVRQTQAERLADERPAALDSAVIRGAQSALGISGLPVIFDLPKPLAITRATEFAKYVHPLLQAYCAKCHNENYNGAFQLVQYKTRADQTSDALRANLDATLRLVDPENLSRSELLSSTLRPHGRGPNKRPIFPGSNDRAYQVLESWVSQLRTPKPTGDTSVLGRPRADTDQSEVFAAQRERISREHLDPRMQQEPRSTSNRGSVTEDQSHARPQEFPLPFVIGGANPAVPQSGMQPRAANRPSAQSATNNLSNARPPAQASTAAMTQETDKPIAPSDPKLPGDQTAATGENATAKKPSKPLKLDPALLQKVLQSRNAGH
jgi:hypothetical protein